MTASTDTSRSSDTMRRDVLTLAALSLIAGVTDVTSWLLLGGFFSAHITGNLVVIAADVVTHSAPNITAALAIPAFVVVTAIATVIARRLARSDGLARSDAQDEAGPSRRVTVILLGAQTVLLIAAAALSFTTRASADPEQPLAVVIGLCAVAAMASQNAYLHLVPLRASSTAVMTGNLVTATVAGVDLLLSGGRSTTARPKWQATWPLLAGFIVGCLVGAAGASLIRDQAALVPAVLSVVLYLAVLLRRS